MLFQSRHDVTKDRSISQGYDGMELLNRIGETPLLFCISGVPEDQTDYPGRRFSYASDVSPLIDWIEETPSLRSGRPPRKAELSRSDLGIEPRASVVFFTP
jgi:hypothetical protein